MPEVAEVAINRMVRRILFLVLLATALAVAVVALYISNESNSKAAESNERGQRTAECVNRVQADRAYAGNLVRDAQLKDARAELARLRGEITDAQLRQVKADYVNAQLKAAAYAADHPAGNC